MNQFQDWFFKDNWETVCQLIKSLALGLQCLTVGQFGSTSALARPDLLLVQCQPLLILAVNCPLSNNTQYIHHSMLFHWQMKNSKNILTHS